ncbi:MAG: 5'/3'-nucleotidase SurE, partial [Actinomycetota bacterium]
HQPVRLLVTNDDGIDSPGLHVLAQRMTEFGDVIVFAPSGEYSGAGAAIGHLGGGIPPVVTMTSHPAMPDVAEVHHLDGPPGLASLLACRGLFGTPPDVVVSGINPGWNVGHAVHFSGTIGACITATTSGIGGLAVSQRRNGSTQLWESAAEAAAQQLDRVADRATVVSVNVDNLPFDQFRGVREVGLSERVPYNMAVASLGSDGSVTFTRGDAEATSEQVDTGAVMAGYIAVSELQPTQVRPTG